MSRTQDQYPFTMNPTNISSQLHQGRQQRCCSYRLNEKHSLHQSQRTPRYASRALRLYPRHPLRRDLPPSLRSTHQDHHAPLDTHDNRRQATPTLLLPRRRRDAERRGNSHARKGHQYPQWHCRSASPEEHRLAIPRLRTRRIHHPPRSLGQDSVYRY